MLDNGFAVGAFICYCIAMISSFFYAGWRLRTMYDYRLPLRRTGVVFWNYSVGLQYFIATMMAVSAHYWSLP